MNNSVQRKETDAVYWLLCYPTNAWLMQ